MIHLNIEINFMTYKELSLQVHHYNMRMDAFFICLWFLMIISS